jgi:hypothetical protein
MSRPPKDPIPPGMMLEKYRGLVPAWNSEEEDPAYDAFLEAANLKSPDMQHALAAASDKRYRELLRQMNLPKNRNRKLTSLAKIMEISMTEFTDFLRQASRARALSLAAQRLPDITSDMADDAMTQKEACGRCDGWGFVNINPEELPPLDEDKPIPGNIKLMGTRYVRDCPKCDGSGKTSKPGDSHARDKIMEMNGFGKKGAAVAVSINNYGGNSIESAGARLANVTFNVDADVIDADVISEGGDPQVNAEERDWNRGFEHSGEGPADGVTDGE